MRDSRTNQPVASAQVHIPELQIGVLAQGNGRFVLVNVPPGQHTVRAERIGYRPGAEQVTVVDNQSVEVNFSLVEDALSLDEIVVTGTAGAARRREVGNTISQINLSTVPEPVTSIDQLLQARAHQAPDFQRERERLAPVLARDQRRPPAGAGFEEVRDLGAQLVAIVEGLLVLGDAALPRVAARHAQLPGLQVGRGVAVVLEHAEFPHRLLAHAARREVRHAAVGELQAHAGDVDRVGEHVKAAGRDLRQLAVRHGEHEVEVVDHQVEHHVDVDAALLEAGEALAFDVQRLAERGGERAERRVEALQVPHRQQRAALPRRGEQRVGLGERRGDGLFHQHVHARLEERQRHVAVLRRGHRDAHEVHAARERARVLVRRAAVLGRDALRARGVGVDHRHELHARGGGELLGVELAEVAHPHDGGAQLVRRHARHSSRCRRTPRPAGAS